MRGLTDSFERHWYVTPALLQMTGRTFATVISPRCKLKVNNDAPATHLILTFVVIVGLLLLVSSISYVKKDDSQDLEVAPNRSTYHSGPTGVRALHDFLNESGYRVIRWKETPQKLLTDSGTLVKTFVVMGDIKVRFTDAEQEALTKWIAGGGHLVLIDRTLNRQRRDKRRVGTSR
jgi:hypothetical protein